ncbi:MAG: phenylacetate--CoA ligase family protein [Stellaceae bacterium]
MCEGMMIDEGIILELVAPGTGDPVAEGEIGEVVVTTLTPEYPLIRFATGDLLAILPGPSRCGRTNQRLKGWLGRADQSVKVRGLFVHPVQIAEVLRRHPAVGHGRLVVERLGGRDEMTLHVELAEGADEPARIAETLQALTKLRGAVRRLMPDTLPQDAKIIEDRREPG